MRTKIETCSLIARGLLGKKVFIQQGDGGESTSYYTGTVTEVFKPDGHLPYWDIILNGNGVLIPVMNGITVVTEMSSRNN
jgi:hypothetical protein